MKLVEIRVLTENGKITAMMAKTKRGLSRNFRAFSYLIESETIKKYKFLGSLRFAKSIASKVEKNLMWDKKQIIKLQGKNIINERL